MEYHRLVVDRPLHHVSVRTPGGDRVASPEAHPAHGVGVDHSTLAVEGQGALSDCRRVAGRAAMQAKCKERGRGHIGPSHGPLFYTQPGGGLGTVAPSGRGLLSLSCHELLLLAGSLDSPPHLGGRAPMGLQCDAHCLSSRQPRGRVGIR